MQGPQEEECTEALAREAAQGRQLEVSIASDEVGLCTPSPWPALCPGLPAEPIEVCASRLSDDPLSQAMGPITHYIYPGSIIKILRKKL